MSKIVWCTDTHGADLPADGWLIHSGDAVLEKFPYNLRVFSQGNHELEIPYLECNRWENFLPIDSYPDSVLERHDPYEGKFVHTYSYIPTISEYEAYVRKQLSTITAKTWIVTHVPPYAECYLRTQVKRFTCTYLGKLLDEFVVQTNIQLAVLCGHTHQEFYYKRNDKIRVLVGEPNYCGYDIQGDTVSLSMGFGTVKEFKMFGE